MQKLHVVLGWPEVEWRYVWEIELSDTYSQKYYLYPLICIRAESPSWGQTHLSHVCLEFRHTLAHLVELWK